MPKVWNSYDPDCPKDAVYIGRPSKWGNQFSHRPSKFPTIPVGSALEAVSMYRHWLNTTEEGKKIAELARTELKGKDLRCFNCKPCHGSVLLEIANNDGNTISTNETEQQRSENINGDQINKTMPGSDIF